MATPSLGVQNWFETTLSSAISSSDTTIPLNTVPTPSEGYLIIEPDSSTNREVIYYTSKTASAVIVPSTASRGKDGTTAISHSSGVTVRMQITKGHFDSLQDGSALALSLLDSNGNEWVRKGVTSSAVNDITVTNAATGNAPSLSATGDDSNISLRWTPKGTGVIEIGENGSSVSQLSAAGSDTNIPLKLAGKGTGTIQHEMRIQTDASNSISSTTIGGLRIQAGWGQINATAAANNSETVTFPTAFSAVPYCVMANLNGFNASSQTDLSGFTTGTTKWECHAEQPSATTFRLRVSTGDGTNLSAGWAAYSWVAIGLA